MQKLIVIKYAELNTKKANIGLFLKTLKKNIQLSVSEEVTINYDKGRMYLIADEKNLPKIVEKLQKVFGIHEIAVGLAILTNDLDEIGAILIKELKLKEFQTFKIETKRSDKTYFMTSPIINKKLGEIVLKNLKNVKVDVHQPQITIYVEIRKTSSYIYFETIKGLGGYPVGTLGKGLLMLSGGIDSPVAGYLAMKRGVKLEAIYFDSPPHTSIMARNKVIKLAGILKEYQGNIKIHCIPFTNLQETIYKEVPKEYMITIMRRMMYRIASIIAHKNNCKILINGESIGQVASQTLESMNVINEVVKIPVIRPVACFDKLEIIELAKKIGTYEISILPYQDCCTIFVPEHPVIYPQKDKCEEYEKLFDYESLIKEAVAKEVIIRPLEENEELDSYL